MSSGAGGYDGAGGYGDEFDDKKRRSNPTAALQRYGMILLEPTCLIPLIVIILVGATLWVNSTGNSLSNHELLAIKAVSCHPLRDKPVLKALLNVVSCWFAERRRFRSECRLAGSAHARRTRLLQASGRTKSGGGSRRESTQAGETKKQGISMH